MSYFYTSKLPSGEVGAYNSIQAYFVGLRGNSKKKFIS